MSEKQSIESVLNERGFLVYPNVGTSMMPLLRQGKDLMEIRKKPAGRCNKYDAVLYKRGERYILHRILKVREHDYIIVGDNCWRREFGIKDEQILGVLTGVMRDGKRIDVNDMRYQRYVHLWCDFFPIRAVILFMIMQVREMKYFIKGASRAVWRRIKSLPCARGGG